MRVLVLEDEPLVAMDIAAIVAGAGWDVVGPAATVQKALKSIEDKGCDAAILDANLGGESAEPVADTLRLRGIPFIVLSGYANDQLQGPLLNAPFLAKPYNPGALVALVRSLCS